MDIGALSISPTPAAIMTEVNVAVLSKSLDTVEQLGQGMITMMEKSVQPHLGQNLNVKL